jgi:hypothetical protein
MVAAAVLDADDLDVRIFVRNSIDESIAPVDAGPAR